MATWPRIIIFLNDWMKSFAVRFRIYIGKRNGGFAGVRLAERWLPRRKKKTGYTPPRENCGFRAEAFLDETHLVFFVFSNGPNSWKCLVWRRVKEKPMGRNSAEYFCSKQHLYQKTDILLLMPLKQ